MLRKQTILGAGGILVLAHICVIASLGTRASGPMLSNIVQFALGGLLITASLRAARRSEKMARSVWHLIAIAYTLWLVAQGLGLYSNVAHISDSVDWVTNLLFCFWFVPLALAMFLDPDNEAGGLDPLAALDFVQAMIVCVAAYLYFYYIPKIESGSKLTRAVWEPYFVGYAFVAGSFLLRAATTRSRVARALFGRWGAFLTLSGLVDVLYEYGPGQDLQTGAWFDILWSLTLFVPLVIAATWVQMEAPVITMNEPRRAKTVYHELIYLFYPLLVLLMSVRIARHDLNLAALVVLVAVACSSARLLVTQHRLVQTQDALRREASRDGLTGLWNRKAILEILERELLRTERQGDTVGVIMADVDHFKAVNDSRGHVAGDSVLRIIASEIAAVVRPYDSVGRYGGEEFFIVVPECGFTETWELAERIRQSVANSIIVAGGSPVAVSLSLGIAVGGSAAEAEKLLSAADTALYQAKHAGRNRVEPSITRSANANQTPVPVQSNFWL